MFANYHTHTVRCQHAIGSEREYIENAITAGFRILGFSDHAPQFTKEQRSCIRMRTDQAPEYVDTLQQLKKEYKKEIEIHIGFEAEYFPDYFDDLRQCCRDLGVEYLLLGQHALFDEFHGMSIWDEHTSRDDIRLYVDQLIQAMDTGAFTYIAHPDAFVFSGKQIDYQQEMLRLCQHAKEKNIPLEVNMLGLFDSRHYPSQRFFQIAQQVGNTLILGCDAHSPQALKDTKKHEAVRAFAERFRLPIVDTVSFCPI